MKQIKANVNKQARIAKKTRKSHTCKYANYASWLQNRGNIAYCVKKLVISGLESLGKSTNQFHT
jgi:hypothetical protein